VIDAASDLGFLPGADSSTGVAINASGQVVGWSAPSTLLFDHAHAFRTAPNGPITPDSDLGTLGGDDIRPVAINASGQVIGTSNLVNGSRISHAFRTSPNGLITPESDLGTLGGSTSEAGGINDWGQVVGIAMLPGDVNSHPYLANMGSPMQDLTTLIEPNTGWRLGEVHGINNLGQICGEGIFGGQLHAFLLTPTPEPASLALALGFFALTARLRKRIGGGDHSHASTDNRPRIN
jgi:probable HAF family extracellular repeat protein